MRLGRWWEPVSGVGSTAVRAPQPRCAPLRGRPCGPGDDPPERPLEAWHGIAVAVPSYTVRSGETLSSIAASLWGDASLWYKLAQANGVTADASLVSGQVLTVPAGVMRSGNSASTFRPYDAAEAMGDLSPTTPTKPKPPKKKGCGIIGQILLVAVAVAIASHGTLPGFAAKTLALGQAAGSVVGGALAGAAGSIASQTDRGQAARRSARGR